MLFSGIDLHKRTIAIQTVDREGVVVRQAQLAAQRPALSAYFATLPGPHRAVVECTGMWYWVRDLLRAQGIDLRLGHAKYLKAISYAKVKTDAVDAATLAQLLRVDLIPEAHMISAEQLETRDLLRARLVLVGRVLRCRRSIGALLEKYNVATPAELPEPSRLQAAMHAEHQTPLAAQSVAWSASCAISSWPQLTRSDWSGSRGLGSSSRTRCCSRSMTSVAFRALGTSTHIVAWCLARKMPVGRCGINDRATGIAI